MATMQTRRHTDWADKTPLEISSKIFIFQKACLHGLVFNVY